jgi:hypothetical protein
MRNSFFFILYSFLFSLSSCNSDFLPKPKAYLSHEYPKKKYQNLTIERPYYFDIQENTLIIDEANNWLKIQYPNLKASVDITYKPIENNLEALLIDAEKLVFKHAVKAEQIIPKDFLNYEYDINFDKYLYEELGYDYLLLSIREVFLSPYSITSLREYWAIGFETWFTKPEKINILQDTCPIIYKKLEELMADE